MLSPGSDSAESGGDKKLRRDVSELISVMAKQGMLTDRQRLFLLAQVNLMFHMMRGRSFFPVLRPKSMKNHSAFISFKA